MPCQIFANRFTTILTFIHSSCWMLILVAMEDDLFSIAILRPLSSENICVAAFVQALLFHFEMCPNSTISISLVWSFFLFLFVVIISYFDTSISVYPKSISFTNSFDSNAVRLVSSSFAHLRANKSIKYPHLQCRIFSLVHYSVYLSDWIDALWIPVNMFPNWIKQINWQFPELSTLKERANREFNSPPFASFPLCVCEMGNDFCNKTRFCCLRLWWNIRLLPRVISNCSTSSFPRHAATAVLQSNWFSASLPEWWCV